MTYRVDASLLLDGELKRGINPNRPDAAVFKMNQALHILIPTTTIAKILRAADSLMEYQFTWGKNVCRNDEIESPKVEAEADQMRMAVFKELFTTVVPDINAQVPGKTKTAFEVYFGSGNLFWRREAAQLALHLVALREEQDRWEKKPVSAKLRRHDDGQIDGPEEPGLAGLAGSATAHKGPNMDSFKHQDEVTQEGGVAAMLARLQAGQ